MNIDQSIQALKVQSRQVSDQIMVTPTGDARNSLTDANIHITAAMMKLREAQLYEQQSAST